MADVETEMSEANNALRIRLHGVSLLQTQNDVVLSDYFDPGEDLHYPGLTNEQANYISIELKSRLTDAMVGLIRELASAKAGGDLQAGASKKPGPAG